MKMWSEFAEFIKELIEENKDISWQIAEVVEFEVVAEDDDVFARIVGRDILYKEQDGYYIDQVQTGDDMFYGTIIKPMHGNTALKIYYNC